MVPSLMIRSTEMEVGTLSFPTFGAALTDSCSPFSAQQVADDSPVPVSVTPGAR